MNTTTIRDTLVVDNGPVADAALILCQHSTLAEHVAVERGDWTTTITAGSAIPFEVWGSGTQALWRLLSAIAYSGETVSLYEVVSRLDARNSRAVAKAVAALCGAESDHQPHPAAHVADLLTIARLRLAEVEDDFLALAKADAITPETCMTAANHLRALAELTNMQVIGS